MGLRRQLDTLAQDPFVKGLLLHRVRFAVHYQHDGQWRVGKVRHVSRQRAQLLQGLRVTHHDELPGLDILGAPAPARHVQQVIDRLLRYGLIREAANST